MTIRSLVIAFAAAGGLAFSAETAAASGGCNGPFCNQGAYPKYNSPRSPARSTARRRRATSRSTRTSPARRTAPSARSPADPRRGREAQGSGDRDQESAKT